MRRSGSGLQAEQTVLGFELKGPAQGMAKQGFGLQHLTNSLFFSFVKQAYQEVGVRSLEDSDSATN